MNRNTIKVRKRTRRKRSIRKRIMGVPARPRLSVFRSAKHIYAQVIDDLAGKTLAAASTRDKDVAGEAGKRGAATAVGRTIAQRAKAAGIEAVVFDRNGFLFHGRIKALADGARDGGLKF